jgi:hypothetical protein
MTCNYGGSRDSHLMAYKRSRTLRSTQIFLKPIEVYAKILDLIKRQQDLIIRHFDRDPCFWRDDGLRQRRRQTSICRETTHYGGDYQIIALRIV